MCLGQRVIGNEDKVMGTLYNEARWNDILVEPDIMKLYGDFVVHVSRGYTYVILDTREGRHIREQLHRLTLPGYTVVHHIDNNPKNNLRDNLLGTTQAINLMLKETYNNKRCDGIEVRPNGRYYARVRFNKRLITIGTFNSYLEALTHTVQRKIDLLNSHIEDPIKAHTVVKQYIERFPECKDLIHYPWERIIHPF